MDQKIAGSRTALQKITIYPKRGHLTHKSIDKTTKDRQLFNATRDIRSEKGDRASPHS
jgi:hypothetical protein